MVLTKTPGYKIIKEWLSAGGRQPFAFQEETWQHVIDGSSGLVNAPTGCGKTFSVFLGALIDFRGTLAVIADRAVNVEVSGCGLRRTRR